jgi:hypothetical protein
MTRAPASIDHTVVAMQVSGTDDDSELSWWEARVADAAARQGITVRG